MHFILFFWFGSTKVTKVTKANIRFGSTKVTHASGSGLQEHAKALLLQR